MKKHFWIYLVFLCMLFLIVPVLAQTTTSITISGKILPQPDHKPEASFIAIPQTGQEPLLVKFTDMSTHSPTSWKWEYKGKNRDWTQFSTAQNASYTFNTGTYDIRLTVKNKAGSDTSIKTNYIKVTEQPKPKKPEAKFIMNPESGKVPLTVTFTDKSSNSPTSYLWNFGDGTTSTVKNPPAHIYTKIGIYKIQLKVSSTTGSDTATKYLIVIPQKWWWFNWKF